MTEIQFGFLGTSDSDLLKLKQFHNQLFPGTFVSLEWLNWYLKISDSPQSRGFNTRTYCAYDDKKLIGLWCVEPKDFLGNDGAIIKVGRCFSVGIHQDYRRQGLFTKLSKFAIESERDIGQYEYILGFPQQGKSVIGAHLKSGWYYVQTIEANSYESGNPGYLTPPANVSLLNVNSITDFHCIKNNETFINSGGFVNGPRYQNKRWLQHPDHHYICLSLGDSFIVIKQYKSICHILELQGTEEGTSSLLCAARTLAFRHKWDELTIWCAQNEKYKNSIKSQGFKTHDSAYIKSVELLAVNINAKIPFAPNDVHFQTGVEEVP
jgi:GNAT superfamily N-acetyltransferase